MKRVLAVYQEHDLLFDNDADGNLWFIIRNSAGVHETAVAFGDGQYEFETKGTKVDDWIDNTFIPRANALLESFFGEAPPVEPEAPWHVQLDTAIRGLTFDPVTRTFSR